MKRYKVVLTKEERERWTLRLLQSEMTKRQYVDEVSDETIRTALKKNVLKPWLKEEWCIPPKANAAFVCQMEEVLGVYQRQYDPKYPQICLDEMSKQLLAEKYEPLSIQPRRVQNRITSMNDMAQPTYLSFSSHSQANVILKLIPIAKPPIEHR